MSLCPSRCQPSRMRRHSHAKPYCCRHSFDFELDAVNPLFRNAVFDHQDRDRHRSCDALHAPRGLCRCVHRTHSARCGSDVCQSHTRTLANITAVPLTTNVCCRRRAKHCGNCDTTSYSRLYIYLPTSLPTCQCISSPRYLPLCRSTYLHINLPNFLLSTF